ncbi:phage tail terminator family protein [Brevibacillus brevis]|uniref:phage tail terminator family protein n=1 Tax=Brevibacillus brevis TaxID=1393 RepID=UPI0011598873|nr:hypothetical protein [Lysinibacillus sp. SDF0063]TQR33973.1 hypothetical protein C7Y45_18430 [Lysinibacillus sp. SDF0063]
MSRLTRAQINGAITNKIKAAFPKVKIHSTDVKEGFSRPSFFTMLETGVNDSAMFSTYREMTCRILFFPSDRYVYKEEAYDVQDKLDVLFGLNFAVEDRTITISNARSNIIDGVLHFDFDFSFHDDAAEDPMDDDNTAKMRELSISHE